MLSFSDRLFIAMMTLTIITTCATNIEARYGAFIMQVIACILYVIVPRKDAAPLPSHKSRGDTTEYEYEATPINYEPHTKPALTALQRPEPLAEFARWVIETHCWEGYSLDGGSVQDKAEKLGLIIATTYDPEKHGTTDLCEPGDPWFELAPFIADKRESP